MCAEFDGAPLTHNIYFISRRMRQRTVLIRELRMLGVAEVTELVEVAVAVEGVWLAGVATRKSPAVT